MIHVCTNHTLIEITIYGYLCKLNEILQTASYQWQLLQTPTGQWDSSASNVEYSNPPKASGFLGLSRCEQGLLNPNPPQKLVLPHKLVRHASLTNWDEENVNPLHTARAGTYCLDVSFGMVYPYIQADVSAWMVIHYAVWVIKMNCGTMNIGPAMW